MDITELDLLLRAVASPTRLRLLAILLRLPAGSSGVSPSVLAPALDVSRSAVSHHLKTLLRLRLVRYWKKGPFKAYGPVRASAHSLRGKLLARLRDELSVIAPSISEDPPKAGSRKPGRSRPAAHAGIKKGPLAGVWDSLTAFSHFRRILMLRHLVGKGVCPRASLIPAMDLDRKTVKYHVAKLLRRGAIEEVAGGLRLCARPETQLQGFMTRWTTDAAPAAGPAA